MKILCISDRVERMLYGPNLTSYAKGVEAVISCGDLPFDYLEYIVTFLGVPVYYVLGNHDPGPEGPEYPGGCTPLDGRVAKAAAWYSRGSPGLPFTRAVPTSTPSVTCAAGRGRSRSESVAGPSSAGPSPGSSRPTPRLSASGTRRMLPT